MSGLNAFQVVSDIRQTKGTLTQKTETATSNAFHQAKSRNEYQIEDTNNQRPHKNS